MKEIAEFAGFSDSTGFFSNPFTDQSVREVLEHEHAIRKAWAFLAMALLTVATAIILKS